MHHFTSFFNFLSINTTSAKHIVKLAVQKGVTLEIKKKDSDINNLYSERLVMIGVSFDNL